MHKGVTVDRTCGSHQRDVKGIGKVSVDEEE